MYQVIQKAIDAFVSLVLLKRKLFNPNYYDRHHLSISFQPWSVSIRLLKHEDYLGEQSLLLHELKSELTGEAFILEALNLTRSCNFLILDCGNQGKFVQFWLGDGKIIANWPMEGKNRLRYYSYAMLGVLNELGITRDFKSDGKWPKLHHCYTLANTSGFPEYAVNFGQDNELASKFTALVLQEVFKEKLENLSFRIG